MVYQLKEYIMTEVIVDITPDIVVSDPATLLQQRISTALEFIELYGANPGQHHKQWVIDQVLFALLGGDGAYRDWIANWENGEDGPETYSWDQGISP